VDEFTVDANFEGTAAGRDQFGIHAGRFPNESRQPGSFRFVVSDRAIFDRDLGFHAGLPSSRQIIRALVRCRGQDISQCMTGSVTNRGSSRRGKIPAGRGQRPRLRQNDALGMRVNVEGGRTQKTDQCLIVLTAKICRQGRRGRHRRDNADTGRQRLLHNFK